MNRRALESPADDPPLNEFELLIKKLLVPRLVERVRAELLAEGANGTPDDSERNAATPEAQRRAG